MIDTQISKKVYDVICVIVMIGAIGYGGAGFMLLTWTNVYAVWSSLYFLPHIVVFLLLIISFVFPAAETSKAKSH